MRHPGQRHGVIPSAEALQNETGRDQIEAGAAILLGNGDAEQAVLADQGKGVLGPPLVGIHALGEAVEFPAGKTVGLVEDDALVIVEIEGALARHVHARSLSPPAMFAAIRGRMRGSARLARALVVCCNEFIHQFSRPLTRAMRSALTLCYRRSLRCSRRSSRPAQGSIRDEIPALETSNNLSSFEL